MIFEEFDGQKVGGQRLDEDSAFVPEKMQPWFLASDDAPLENSLLVQRAGVVRQASPPEVLVHFVKAVDLEVAAEERVHIIVLAQDRVAGDSDRTLDGLLGGS